MRLIGVLAACGMPAWTGPTTAGESACQVAGYTPLWAMSFCMSLHETDDELHPEVSACFLAEQATIRLSSTENDCAMNLAYKSAICSLAVQHKSLDGSLLECISSEDMIPSIVTNGGI